MKTRARVGSAALHADGERWPRPSFDDAALEVEPLAERTTTPASSAIARRIPSATAGSKTHIVATPVRVGDRVRPAVALVADGRALLVLLPRLVDPRLGPRVVGGDALVEAAGEAADRPLVADVGVAEAARGEAAQVPARLEQDDACGPCAAPGRRPRLRPRCRRRRRRRSARRSGAAPRRAARHEQQQARPDGRIGSPPGAARAHRERSIAAAVV